jgi:hypothetical protein
MANAQDYVYFNQLVKEYQAALARAEQLRTAAARLSQLDQEMLQSNDEGHTGLNLTDPSDWEKWVNLFEQNYQKWETLFEQEKHLLLQSHF